jgi:hypothetical protein
MRRVPPRPPRKEARRGRKMWCMYEKANLAGASEYGKGGYAVTGNKPVTEAKSWSSMRRSRPGNAWSVRAKKVTAGSARVPALVDK